MSNYFEIQLLACEMSLKRLFLVLPLYPISGGLNLFSEFAIGPCKQPLSEIILNLSPRIEDVI